MRRVRLSRRKREGEKSGMFKAKTFTISVSYDTKPQNVSERVVDVATAFGVGTDKHFKFTVFKDFSFKIKQGDIVYVTGDSGSGKSTLLRKLKELLGEKNVADINDVKIDYDKPIVDQIGKNTNEALKYLTMVGLGDAFLFLRRFGELSEGQKYRFKIAKLLETEKPFLILDEFCSTLDRDTAKIVAYNLQRVAREQGKTVIVATCDRDLKHDLNPDVYIEKGIGDKVDVEYAEKHQKRVCSIARKVKIEEGTVEDYRKLEHFHYRAGKLPHPYKIFKMTYNGEIIGVIVYSYPPILSFGRNRYFGYRIPVKQLNKDFVIISRVVIHPKFRGIGLGVKLVKETLPLVDKKYVETVAVMAKYNPFFEKAGMKKVAVSTPDETVVNAIRRLEKMGFNPITLASEQANLEKLRKMSKKQKEQIKQILLSVDTGYYKRLMPVKSAFAKKQEFIDFLKNAKDENLAIALRNLAVLSQSKVYLIWENPKYAKRGR